MSKILRASDYAKAFGILLVVFGHTLRGLFSADLIIKDEFWSAVDEAVYLFHMPLFFYLSGLFLRQSVEDKGWKSLSKHAFLTLIIPMIVWSYLQFSLQYAASSYSNSQLDLFYVLTAPFPPRQQFWFLAVLFLMITATSFLLRHQLFQRILWPVVIAGFVGQAIAWDDTLRYMSDKPVLYILLLLLLYWPYFLLGIVFGTEEVKKFRLNTFSCTIIFLTALGAYQVVEEFRAVLSLLCVLSIYKISINMDESTSEESRTSKIIVFVGINTMIIYLAHVIFAAGFRTVLLRLNVEDPSIHLFGGSLAGIIGPLALVPVALIIAQKFPAFARYIFPVRVKRIKSGSHYAA